MSREKLFNLSTLRICEAIMKQCQREPEVPKLGGLTYANTLIIESAHLSKMNFDQVKKIAPKKSCVLIDLPLCIASALK